MKTQDVLLTLISSEAAIAREIFSFAGSGVMVCALAKEIFQNVPDTEVPNLWISVEKFVRIPECRMALWLKKPDVVPGKQLISRQDEDTLITEVWAPLEMIEQSFLVFETVEEEVGCVKNAYVSKPEMSNGVYLIKIERYTTILARTMDN